MPNLKKIYNNQGYLYKFRAIKNNEAKYIFNKFNQLYFKKNSGIINEELVYKPHLILKSFFDLTENKNILKVVKKILGEKIVLWNSLIFYKKKKNFVSFHQDLQYWKFKNSNCLTVSLALTHSDIDNGCLQVIPGSHKKKYNHKKRFRDKYNLLGSNQNVELSNYEKPIPFILKPGEFTVHHGNILHGSYANKLSSPRALFAMRFASYENSSKIYKYANYLFDTPNKKKYFIELPRCIKDYDDECLKYRELLIKDAINLQISLKQKKLNKLLNPLKFIIFTKIFRKIIYYFLR